MKNYLYLYILCLHKIYILKKTNKNYILFLYATAKSRKIDATISDTPIEVIDLLSPEPPDETEMNVW